jgi:NADP-dependent aldehyde dehydrogenase
LVQHPLTTAVAFTGSLQGGRAIMDAAAARSRPIPVYAEMGSTNPVFVMPQALEDAAATIAEGYVQSVNLGVGQFCTNPGLLLLPNGPTADVFLQAVKTAAEKVAAAPMLHAGILANYENGVAHLAECKGVQRLAAGGSADPGTAACSIFVADVELLSQQPSLADELFGPASLVLRCDRVEQMVECARHLEGHLTATIHGTEQELRDHAALVRLLQRRVGRVIFNGFPTGIEVCAAMHHGGPYPATGHSGFTSIGPAAIYRFVKPTCYQNFPDACLPPELQNANPLGITRLVDDQLSSAALD